MFGRLAISFAAISFAAICLVCVPAVAAPAGALNKTVRASFSYSAPAKGSDGSTISGTRQVQRTVYISSQGRIFNRHNEQEGRNSAERERGPGVTNMRFAGNSIVGVHQQASGAVRMTINFSADFRSCTIDVIAGGEGGKPVQFKGLNGIMYTTTGKPQISGQSCSVSEGNAL